MATSRLPSLLALALVRCSGGGEGTSSETSSTSSTSTTSSTSASSTTVATDPPTTTANTTDPPTTGATGTDTSTTSDPVAGTCVQQAGATPGLTWSLICGSTTMDYFPRVTAIDGGVLVGFDFGNGGAVPGEAALDLGGGPHINHGGGDILVGAFDASGTHLWSQQWSDPNGQFFGGLAGLTGDRFILTGAYRDTLTIDGVSFPAPTVPGDSNSFLAILQGSGKYVTHRLFPRGTVESFVSIIASAGGPSGEFAITGSFSETIDFGDGMLVAEDLSDGFVAVYEPDGSFRFVRALTGTSQGQRGDHVTFASDGSLAIAGSFFEELDVDDGQPLSGSGPFLLTLSAAGAPTFKRSFTGNTGEQYGRTIAVAANGDLILGGTFLGMINLGGDDLVNLDQDQVEETHYDVFVARFDPQGAHRWSVRLGDFEDDQVLAVGVGADDRVLAPWSGKTTGVRVTAIDELGVTSEPFAAAVSGGSSATFAADGSIYIAGSIDSDIDFGAGPVANAGATDVWLVRVTPEP